MKKRNYILGLGILMVAVVVATTYLRGLPNRTHLPSKDNDAMSLTELNASVIPSAQPVLSAVDTATSDSAKLVDFDLYKLYALINAYRKEQKLSPLLLHPSLEASANLKLQDMITNKYYRHQDTDHTPSWYLFKKAQYDYTNAGENLSFGLQTPWQVFEGWKASVQHNEQLLSPEYRDMGGAVDCTTFAQYPDGGCIVVLHLGAQ